MNRRIRRLQRKQPRTKWFLCLLFSLIFLVSSGFFLRSFWKTRQEQTELTMLAQAVSETEKNNEIKAFRSTVIDREAFPSASEPTILSQFQELAAQNPELAGWIQITGTKIDYPVMLPVSNPDYYLNHAFDGSASYSGVPFIGQGSTESSDNMLIYGHHMKNGTMFADLMKYKDKAFWREHPLIRFDTLYNEQGYEVIGAFYSKVYYTDETDVFRYYNYGGRLERVAFEEYVSLVRQSALYDTGITAAYGDQLITLSTCSYHTDNGRFVVVARKQTKVVSKNDYEGCASKRPAADLSETATGIKNALRKCSRIYKNPLYAGNGRWAFSRHVIQKPAHTCPECHYLS